MRQRLVRELKCFDAQPIENFLAAGTPDVTTTMGWMELKWKREWPKRASTPLRVAHFTSKQRRWHRRHAERGGVSWVLLQVKQEWFLFEGVAAADHLGEATRDTLDLVADLHLTKGFDRRKIQETMIEGFKFNHGVIMALYDIWEKHDGRQSSSNAG